MPYRGPGPDRPAAEQHFFQKVYFHRIGDKPAKDAYVLGQDFPKVAEIFLDNRFNANHVLVTVANGDGGEYAHYLIAPDGSTRQVTHFEDKVVAAVIGPDDQLYLVSRKDAPRGKLLKLDLAEPSLERARLIMPESQYVIQPGGEFGGEPVVVTSRALYVREVDARRPPDGVPGCAGAGHDARQHAQEPIASSKGGAVERERAAPLQDEHARINKNRRAR